MRLRIHYVEEPFNHFNTLIKELSIERHFKWYNLNDYLFEITF
jgi:hypothetical protein